MLVAKSNLFIFILSLVLISCNESKDVKEPDSDQNENAAKNLSPKTPEQNTDSFKPKTNLDSHFQKQKTCPYKAEPIKKEFYHDTKDGKRIYVCCKECLPQLKANPDIAITLIKARGERPMTIEEAKRIH